MKTLRKISHAPLTWLGLLLLALLMVLALKLSVRAQGVAGNSPSPEFQEVDIGSNTRPGGTQSDGSGSFLVTSYGGDIFGSQDSFHYVFQPIGTNEEVVVRVLGISATDGNAKAGLIVRPS